MIELSTTAGQGIYARPATIVIAASNSKDTSDADYVCTGTNDDTTINTALAALPAAGGRIILLDGTFTIGTHVLISRSNVELQGMGTGTILKQANSANVDSVLKINGTNISQIKVSNLLVDGNKANNTFGNGILMQTPGASNSWVILQDVVVQNCPNNGVAWNANSGSSSYYIQRVHSTNNGGSGFYAQYSSGCALTDSVFDSCIADTNALNGFYLATLDTHYINCKSYFNGSAGGSNHGFYLSGYNNYFTGCQAQDNYGCGFFLNNDGDPTYGTQNNVFVNCDADSNNNPSNSRGATTANSPLGYGWYINNTAGTMLVGCQAYVRPYPFAWGQNIGVGLLGTTTGTNINDLTGSGNTTTLYIDTSSGLNNYANNNQKLLPATVSGGSQQYGIPGTQIINVNTSSLNANSVRYTPVFIPYAVTITGIAFEVTTGPSGNANGRIGIYAMGNNGQPTGTPIYDSGSIAVASGFTGIKTLTGLNINLQPGYYLIGMNCDVSFTLRTFSSPSFYLSASFGGAPMMRRGDGTLTYGAYPSTPAPWTSMITSTTGFDHVVAFQWT